MLIWDIFICSGRGVNSQINKFTQNKCYKAPKKYNVFREFLDQISKNIIMRSGRDNEK